MLNIASLIRESLETVDFAGPSAAEILMGTPRPVDTTEAGFAAWLDREVGRDRAEREMLLAGVWL